ncbi:hypothetical protein CEXT_561941 [Caerostris extrusa]|uniref:Uncharacterized protein n=1 Tax=Caerostris extrusa TaxID=172846 RepID=A0AAV4NLM2_CAEEX|nr:hypothetical protein CEXT_561941 [Caerostris extrusa]
MPLSIIARSNISIASLQLYRYLYKRPPIPSSESQQFLLECVCLCWLQSEENISCADSRVPIMSHANSDLHGRQKSMTSLFRSIECQQRPH